MGRTQLSLLLCIGSFGCVAVQGEPGALLGLADHDRCTPGGTYCDGNLMVQCSINGERAIEAADCAPGSCLDGECVAPDGGATDGSSSPDAGGNADSASTPDSTEEQCPPNSQPSGSACACDDGFEPDLFGLTCVPVEEDRCEDNGWYGDGECDDFCPKPDPDCNTEDLCETNGWYGDGLCDDFCPNPDPDCQPGACTPPCDTTWGESCVEGVCYEADGCPHHAYPEGDYCYCDPGYEPDASGRECV